MASIVTVEVHYSYFAADKIHVIDLRDQGIIVITYSRLA